MNSTGWPYKPDFDGLGWLPALVGGPGSDNIEGVHQRLGYRLSDVVVHEDDRVLVQLDADDR